MTKIKDVALITFFYLITAFLYSCSTVRPINVDQTKPYFPPDKALFDTIAYQDSLLFNAFNNRNLEKLMSFFASNLEVYQDNIGVRSFAETGDAFKGVFAKDYILNRQLVKGSLEVYPIKDYGAIETGRHTFCHTENGKLDCGTFKFLQIWQRQNGQWKITRIVTFDHKL